MTGTSQHPTSTRLLVVILTHERPDELKRCVDVAVPTLGSEDLLVVLDDSSLDVSRANAGVLVKATNGSGAHCFHITADSLHKAISQVLGGRMAPWQLKIAGRDIAPLRNLSLLVSAAMGPQTTVLIDDDVFNFDVTLTHRICEDLCSAHEGLVTGATISGLSDLDTISRLSNALRFLAINGTDLPMSIDDLFHVPSTDDGEASYSGCLSAGYMAFRLLPANLFAFPPGYNEDWLWCLLHRALGNAWVVKTDQVVLHEPLRLRHPTRDDILFETHGDLILDSLVDGFDGARCIPERTLQQLSSFEPDVSTLPSSRAASILAQAGHLQQEGHLHVLTDLQDYGLTLLRELLEAGELEIDGPTELRDWSADALVKHRSFALTIKTSTVFSAVRQALTKSKL